MDWTTLWMLATVVAFLEILFLHLIWRAPNHTSHRNG
jgi:hypothetical protein